MNSDPEVASLPSPSHRATKLVLKILVAWILYMKNRKGKESI